MNQALNVEHPAPPPDSFEDLRGAQRFTLLIRTAKLVSESGEYLCIIRDVSETGVRLKLFHDLPPDRHLALELANGEVYFVERVWEREGHAGFRFSAPIDVQGFIEEVSPFPRRPVRLRMDVAAALSAGGPPTPATLRDLSQQGAGIVCQSHFSVGERVRISVEGMPAITARVRWRGGAEYGLSFEQFFTLDEVARLAAEMQSARPLSPAPPIAETQQATSCA
jgi:hypothetical protein